MVLEAVMAFLTWVCRWDDGPKEEAVSEVKIPPKLTHNFHEGHKAVHDESEKKMDKSSKTIRGLFLFVDCVDIITVFV